MMPKPGSGLPVGGRGFAPPPLGLLFVGLFPYAVTAMKHLPNWGFQPTRPNLGRVFLLGPKLLPYLALPCFIPCGVRRILLGVRRILLGVCRILLGVCHIRLGVCRIRLGVCHIRLRVCRIGKGLCRIRKGVCRIRKRPMPPAPPSRPAPDLSGPLSPDPRGGSAGAAGAGGAHWIRCSLVVKLFHGA